MPTNTMAVSAQSQLRTLLSFTLLIIAGITAIVVSVNVLEFGRLILIFDYQAYFYPTSFLAFVSFFFFLYLLFLLDAIFTRRLGKAGGFVLLIFNLLCLTMVYRMDQLFKGLFELWVHPSSGEFSPYRTSFFLDIQEVAYSAGLSYQILIISLHLSLIWGVYNLYRWFKK